MHLGIEATGRKQEHWLGRLWGSLDYSDSIFGLSQPTQGLETEGKPTFTPTLGNLRNTYIFAIHPCIHL